MFDPVAEGGLYHVRETVVVLGASATLIARAAPNRIALMFSAGSSLSAIQYDTSPGVTVSSGLTLASGTVALLRWQDLGPLVGYAWYAVSGGMGLSMTVKEVLWVGEQ